MAGGHLAAAISAAVAGDGGHRFGYKYRQKWTRRIAMKRNGVLLSGVLFAVTTTALALSGAAAQDAQTLAVFTKSHGNPVARAVRAGVDHVARREGFQVFHYIPTSAENAPQQIALVDEALKAKYAAYVFTPVDIKALVPAATQITATGVPLVNVADKLTGGNATAFVGTDDYAIALATARVLLKAMDGKGNLVVLEGPETIPTASIRLRGFRDALKEFPNVKVILTKNANYARPVAADLLKTMLKLNPPPQIDGVLAANDAMALGALEALKSVNKKSLIVGINASKEVVDLIKAGEILASGDYNGYIEGCIGAEIAFRALRKQPTPKELVLKSVVAERSNIATFEVPADKRPCPSYDSVVAN
jgi:ribose transport system substrate-binding protein